MASWLVAERFPTDVLVPSSAGHAEGSMAGHKTPLAGRTCSSRNLTSPAIQSLLTGHPYEDASMRELVGVLAETAVFGASIGACATADPIDEDR